MNRNYRRWGAAALTLVLCLEFAPLAAAKPVRDGVGLVDPGERVVRVINKIKKAIRGISTLNDYPQPPKP